MGWSLDKGTGVWKCTQYTDLQYAEITNLAEYGQPMSPYEPGFDQNFMPDFGNVVIEMPQLEVMNHGYGANVTANSFPIVRRFLSEPLSFPYGVYSFNDLVKLGFATPRARSFTSTLYAGGDNGVSAGSITLGDAAYIHGTVSLALMAHTRFHYVQHLRRVDAEIGALDDNWDYSSSTVSDRLNAVVGTLLGPDHYSLDGPIRLRFRGPGKRSQVDIRN